MKAVKFQFVASNKRAGDIIHTLNELGIHEFDAVPVTVDSPVSEPTVRRRAKRGTGVAILNKFIKRKKAFKVNDLVVAFDKAGMGSTSAYTAVRRKVDAGVLVQDKNGNYKAA